MIQQTKGPHLQAKFHLNVFVVSAPVAKNHNFGQILTFLGAPVPTPFTYEGQMWCATSDQRYTLICQISSRSVYSVAVWRRKPPNFAVFGLRHFVVSPLASWQQPEKFEHGCATTNLALSNGVKIVSVLQRLHGDMATPAAGEIRAH